MVPNSVLLQLAVIPLREPERVELRARFAAEVTPGEVQSQLEERIAIPLRHPPQVTLEELDRDEVVVRILATPQDPHNGSDLASEVLEAVREKGRVGDGARP
jgi:small-conductance mechanosensitive channel